MTMMIDKYALRTTKRKIGDDHQDARLWHEGVSIERLHPVDEELDGCSIACLAPAQRGR